MIRVPFTIDLIHDDADTFLNTIDYMPWLTYLKENCERCEIDRHRNEATLQEYVVYQFYLEPKKETFYRLKYGG